MRQAILQHSVRADGRGTSEVRPIWSRAGVLPRTHGSALFTRGETQVRPHEAPWCGRYSQRCAARPDAVLLGTG